MIGALDKIEELDARIRDAMEMGGILGMQAERAELDAKVKEYVLKKGNIETPTHKLTLVTGFTRRWDGETLARIVPKGLFLKIVDYVPNPDKIDEFVKAGKLDEKKIGKAFIETAKSPYVKITRKKDQDDGEADRVAKALA